jgi:hypothetical protein
MQFIQNEIYRIRSEIKKCRVGSVRYKELYAAFQALHWVLNHEAVKSPLECIAPEKD